MTDTGATEALARALDGDDTPPWEVAERLAALGYKVVPIARGADPGPLPTEWYGAGSSKANEQAAEAARREAADGGGATIANSAAADSLDVEALAAECDTLRQGLMVNMRIPADEALLWARRLIEADARVLKPWLSDPAAYAAAKEAAR